MLDSAFYNVKGVTGLEKNMRLAEKGGHWTVQTESRPAGETTEDERLIKAINACWVEVRHHVAGLAATPVRTYSCESNYSDTSPRKRSGVVAPAAQRRLVAKLAPTNRSPHSTTLL